MGIDKDSLGFLVADVSRLLRNTFQRRLGAGNLTFLQARALVYISRHEGVRQNQLAELLEIQPITLVHIIDQLEARKLVKRTTDARDRRAKLLFLAPTAQSVLDSIEAVVESIRDDAMSGLDNIEAAQTIAALHRIRANLNPEALA
ncbi:MAG: MarR family transcriptional regulator [Pseudomonadales bacterium]|nr:MarR family transcriptional regulator [Pseudomonadales bacterium]